MNRALGGVGAALLAVLACSVQEASPPRAAAPLAVDEIRAPDAATGRRSLEFFVTGADDGYLDACGCDNGLLGGLPRRKTLLDLLRAGDEEALVLSNGGLVVGATPLDRMKFDVMMLAMAEMGYAAVAVTEHELALGREQLTAMALLLGDGGALLGTNLIDRAAAGTADGAAQTPLPIVPMIARTLRVGRVAVLSAVSTARSAAYRAADPAVELADPVRAAQAALAAAGGADHVVVLAQMNDAEATRLAQALPEIDWIVIPGDVHEDFPREEPLVVGATQILTTGRKGKFLGALRFAQAGELAEYRRHPIVDTLDKDATIEEMLRSLYRERLFVEEPIREYFEQSPPPGGAAYAGAEEGSCASCHPKAWAIWANSKHARAWQTLVDQDLPTAEQAYGKRLPHAIWDPDCVRCHVTGFGFVSGYAGMEREAERKDARLIDVGCEACHGPAGDHAERASAGDPHWPGGPIAKVATGAAEALCMQCHDPDNSPHFELKAYWQGLIQGEPRPSIAHDRATDDL